MIRFVDPDRGGQLLDAGPPPAKAFGMGLIGGLQHLLPLRLGFPRLPVVDGGRGQQCQARMVVLLVIPVEESLGPAPDLDQGAEAVGVIGSILEGLEMRLGVAVIIANVGPGMALGDPQVVQQLLHRLGDHRCALVVMQGQLLRRDPLTLTAGLDQDSGQVSRLALSHHPAHHIPAEDVEDDIQIEVAPHRRTAQFGDVPRPHLIGGRGQQLRLGGGRVPQWVAPFPDLVLDGQHPIHRPLSTQLASLIQQLRPHPAWLQVLEAGAVEHLSHLGPLLRRQRRGGRGSGDLRQPRGRVFRHRTSRPIPATARHFQHLAGPGYSQLLGQLISGGDHILSPSTGSVLGEPSRSHSLFCIAIIVSACLRRPGNRVFSRCMRANSSRCFGASGTGVGTHLI